MEIFVASKQNRQLAFDVRAQVFVGEQKVSPQIEMDGNDDNAIHVVATKNGIAIGCARILLENDSAHVGRLAVLKEYRNKGVGSAICRFVVAYCKTLGVNKIWLNSQLHAVDFYKKLGFAPFGEIFVEANMQHIAMVFEN